MNSISSFILVYNYLYMLRSFVSLSCPLFMSFIRDRSYFPLQKCILHKTQLAVTTLHLREIVFNENVLENSITVKSLIGFPAMNFDEGRNYQNPPVKAPAIKARAALRIAFPLISFCNTRH